MVIEFLWNVYEACAFKLFIIIIILFQSVVQ